MNAPARRASRTTATLAALLGLAVLAPPPLWASVKGIPGDADKQFAQLETLLPTPGITRSASGAPGPGYWQQRADYRIKAKLDEKLHRIGADVTESTLKAMEAKGMPARAVYGMMKSLAAKHAKTSKSFWA